ncbi:MAG: tail fiber domain-containing protein [Dyadobacter sp.]|uniref:tail fiber domain-containing protein n=1 Tax=Dyadobacter sp. TaxID=1914288 RepID=UPI001B281FB5|nr:tail fiber domain-containing protein [Dyadobacter sp.]MBO9611358.1 tail fiber domain-containing protein [Dyadobacter sp.]
MIVKRLLTRRFDRKVPGTLMLAATMLLASVNLFAQVKIGNNPTVINGNAVLDVESATKGILFPRMALTATTNPLPLSAHVAGMQIYNTATGADVDPGIYYNDGTKWVRVGAEVEQVFVYGSGAPSGSCTTGTMYVDTLEDSPTEGNTWSCVGGAWVDYNPPATGASTPFYIARTAADAKGNKVSAIWRRGYVGVNVNNPRSDIHTAGRILLTRNGYNNVGLTNGTHPIGGVVNYFNNNTRDAYVAVQSRGGNTAALFLSKSFATSNDVYVRFALTSNGSTAPAGSITRGSGYTVLYNTTSDVRLKENIKPTHYGIQDLMKIEVKDYNYISDKKAPTTGFLAQQLYKVFPAAVTVGGKDAGKNPWSVDYGKLTPLLVKAVQEQQSEIEKLKTQNELLQKELVKVATLNDKLEEMQAKLARLLASKPEPTNASK